MKKIIRLTESDLINIIRLVLNEDKSSINKLVNNKKNLSEIDLGGGGDQFISGGKKSSEANTIISESF
jgi:hypothetical protein